MDFDGSSVDSQVLSSLRWLDYACVTGLCARFAFRVADPVEARLAAREQARLRLDWLLESRPGGPRARAGDHVKQLSPAGYPAGERERNDLITATAAAVTTCAKQQHPRARALLRPHCNRVAARVAHARLRLVRVVHAPHGARVAHNAAAAGGRAGTGFVTHNPRHSTAAAAKDNRPQLRAARERAHHVRQWCLRRIMLNGSSHSMHAPLRSSAAQPASSSAPPPSSSDSASSTPSPSPSPPAIGI